jgi:hypothetical protein
MVPAGGPTKLDARVAPRLHAARGIAQPLAAHAQPADEADITVHGDQLAMIACEPCERALDTRRIEAANFSARLDERTPQARRGNAEVAEPIVQHAHSHAGPRALGHRRNEFASDIVVRYDVVLEEDGALRLRDRIEPHREILFGVLEQTHRVAREERRPRSTRESLLGEDAQRRGDGTPFGNIGHAGRYIRTMSNCSWL